MSTDEKFESWAIVALFGHKQLAGKVTEEEVGGCSFVRVDIPTDDGKFRTKLLGNGAIYGIDLVSEEAARLMAKRLGTAPIGIYDLPEPVRQALRQHQLALESEGSEVWDVD